MGMATIRAKGEKKSWSEQNKERVWAVVTSCLTNVPPTLPELLLLPEPLPQRLRAAGARSSVAWGGFLATRRPNAPSYPHFGSPNPPLTPDGAGTGPFSSPSPASSLSGVHPQRATAVRAPDGARLSLTLGPRETRH